MYIHKAEQSLNWTLLLSQMCAICGRYVAGIHAKDMSYVSLSTHIHVHVCIFIKQKDKRTSVTWSTTGAIKGEESLLLYASCIHFLSKWQISRICQTCSELLRILNNCITSMREPPPKATIIDCLPYISCGHWPYMALNKLEEGYSQNVQNSCRSALFHRAFTEDRERR